MTDILRLQKEDIDISRLLIETRDDADGAQLVFVGTVRNDADSLSGLEIEAFVPAAEKDLADIACEAETITTRRMHHRHKYNLNGAVVEIVRPMHNAEFCANCNRLRITSDGLLKPCLLRTGNEVSIKGLKGDALIDAVRCAVQNRSPYFGGKND